MWYKNNKVKKKV